MTASAMGLALCFIGAVFIYRSIRTVAPQSGSGDQAERELRFEQRPQTPTWLPDQDPNRIVEWVKGQDKARIGFLLLAAGFAFQLLGFFVPGSRIVG